ncbi:MAG: hypothetical protein J5U17_12205 [Candidatus Methanoperedens sp.]|nr:hypothetical protein [Candidatus Methanoperedens sp.]
MDISRDSYKRWIILNVKLRCCGSGGELARTKEVYLVCFERVGNCHRFMLVDKIKGLMLDDACRRVNRLVTALPDLVKASYGSITKALHVEA